MGEYDYDLVVIGGGPAGEKGAAQAAFFKYRVALVEKEIELGGACINTGTLASKTLRETALFLSGAKARQLYGITTSVRDDITLADFMYRKNYVQEREHERARKNLQRHGIERITARASFVDAHTVKLDGQEGTRNITSKFFLIATGSTPARPKDIPFNPDNVFDSDTVLEMKAIPKSMIVIGGGVIGSEYAGIFGAIGLTVHLVHRGPRLLEFLDGEIVEALMHHLQTMGVELVMNDGYETVTREGSQVRVKLKSGRELVSGSLLYAAGRSGNTAALGLEQLGIPLGKYGHVEGVNPNTYQTVVPHIYAAGDVIGPPALASTSMEQARLAMCHAFKLKYREQRLDPILPAGIYTIPEISCVGETEESCKKKGIAYIVGRSKFGMHARGQIIGDTDGLIKLIFKADDGRLLGVHVIGENAAELVHVGMACMHFNGHVEYFIESVFNYPTLSDVYKYAAYEALAQLATTRTTHPAAIAVAKAMDDAVNNSSPNAR